MTILRTYDHSSDFDKVGQLLIDTYHDPDSPQTGHINWLQPRWEYMHFHPLIREVDLSRIGVWEDAGEIVGVAHPEFSGSPTYFEIRPGYESLKAEMLGYSEERIDRAEERHEGIYLMEGDEQFAGIVATAGYKLADGAEPTSVVTANLDPDVSPIPDGFRLRSLADLDAPTKVHRLLYRGFNHGGEPDEDGVADRKFMESAPNFNRNLNIVAEAPNGDLVSFGGMWFEPNSKYGYVEPVATDPDYRSRGLGKAVVVESIRRCRELGAETVFVGATLPIYLSIGFKKVYSLQKWSKSK